VYAVRRDRAAAQAASEDAGAGDGDRGQDTRGAYQADILTNLPPRLGPRQVADLYRVRWEVELGIRLDKSVYRLDQIEAERPCSVKTLLHASLIASIITALLAHTHNLQTRPPQERDADRGASAPSAPGAAACGLVPVDRSGL
jgi:hypothetical protein